MGKISGKQGPDSRVPIQRISVKGFGEGGNSGKPLKKLTKKRQSDYKKVDNLGLERTLAGR
jgi:hypothetical protein